MNRAPTFGPFSNGICLAVFFSALLFCGCAHSTRANTSDAHEPKGVLLESLTWVEADAKLNSNAVVVLPIGAGAKEHGPHLLLENDFLIAEYLKRHVLAEANVVVAPTLNYHHYPG